MKMANLNTKKRPKTRYCPEPKSVLVISLKYQNDIFMLILKKYLYVNLPPNIMFAKYELNLHRFVFNVFNILYF